MGKRKSFFSSEKKLKKTKLQKKQSKGEDLETVIKTEPFDDSTDVPDPCVPSVLIKEEIKEEPLNLTENDDNLDGSFGCKEENCRKCKEQQLAYCFLHFHECFFENNKCIVCCALSQHLVGENSYHVNHSVIACVFCGRTFDDLCDLQEHDCQIIVTVKKQCFQCSYLTTSVGNFLKHILHSHCGVHDIESAPISTSSTGISKTSEIKRATNNSAKINGVSKTRARSEYADDVDFPLEEESCDGSNEMQVCDKETCHVCFDRQSALCMLEFHMCPVALDDGECEVCQQVANHLVLVANDKSIHVGCSIVRCVFCISTFSDMQALKTHNCEAMKGDVWRCRHCGVKIKSFHKLCYHLFYHFNVKAFACNLCDQTFVMQYRYEAHVRDHTLPPKYKCPECQQPFLRNRELKNHLFKSHGKEKPYQCGKCGKSFGANFQLALHKTTHEEKKPFPCSKCDRSFVKARNLEHHEYNFHASAGWLTCNLCSRKLASPARLKNHMKSHDNSRAFKCSKCDNAYATQGTLNRHFRIHTEKILNCEHEGCNYTTFYTWQLRTHEFQHSGIKPVPCKLCPRGFASKRSLVKHLAKQHEFTFEEHLKLKERAEDEATPSGNSPNEVDAWNSDCSRSPVLKIDYDDETKHKELTKMGDCSFNLK